MDELFLTVLNMSFTASYVILFVIFVRLFLKKAPKIISYTLWAVVAIRLIIPFSLKSMFSLMPRKASVVPIPHDIIYHQNPQINSGIDVVDAFVNNSLPAPIMGASVNPLQIYVGVGAFLWVLGIIALLAYSFVSILVLKKRLKNAQLVEQNVFEVKNLKTPFVLGLISPKIYLPDGLKATERNYILLHEQTHIQRKDHFIKIFAFLVLSIHWFNPFVWLAFMLMSKDMELSCDERVLKQLNNEDIKKSYANSLLSLATGQHILNSSPLAFGEGNVKSRIKNVLNYKKPKFGVVVLVAILAVAIGIGLLVNPSMPRLITGYMVIEDDLMYVDEVEIIYREDTERIEELEKLGESITTPSGYHIYNPTTDKQVFKITGGTTYTFVDYNLLFLKDETADRSYTTSNKEEFMLHLDESYFDSPPAQKVPFFIEVKDDKVISITEKIQFTI